MAEKRKPSKPLIKIGAKLGSGSFGEIRLARYENRDEVMAIKLELKDATSPTLHFEYKYYRLLGPVEGIPKIYYFGSCGRYNALVMQRLGNSLQKCFQMAGSKFTTKTTIQVALQMLDRIEYVHSKSIVYRDVKPENFVFGNTETDRKQLYIIDFGLAKHYKDPLTGEHIPKRTGKSTTGTARYMSINTHLGIEQSRRDDLEAIGHTLIYFLRGSLPWQNLICEPGEKCRRIGEVKATTSVALLCKEIPNEFATYLNYCRKLDFKETPDYNYLRKLFTELFKRSHFKEDNVYDWEQKIEQVKKVNKTDSQLKGYRSKIEYTTSKRPKGDKKPNSAIAAKKPNLAIVAKKSKTKTNHSSKESVSKASKKPSKTKDK